MFGLPYLCFYFALSWEQFGRSVRRLFDLFPLFPFIRFLSIRRVLLHAMFEARQGLQNCASRGCGVGLGGGLSLGNRQVRCYDCCVGNDCGVSYGGSCVR